MNSCAQVYSFYGCRLESALPLCFVPLAAAEGQADVVVAAGEVPTELADAVWTTPFVSVGRDGAVLIRVDAVGGFLVRGGNAITVDITPAAAAVEVEAFFAGPVAGALLHQRGVLPLHASCVETGGSAIALTGSVGRGKSTLAAALVRRGARLMTDDICAITFCGEGTPLAIPGSRGLRLRPDSREAFGCDGAGWMPVRPGHAKHIGRWNQDEIAEPMAPRRLGAIVRLTTNRADPEIIRLHGPLAVAPMKDLVYRLRIGRLLGHSESLFLDLMRVADKVPIYELRRPHGFDKIDETADMLLGALAGSL